MFYGQRRPCFLLFPVDTANRYLCSAGDIDCISVDESSESSESSEKDPSDNSLNSESTTRIDHLSDSQVASFLEETMGTEEVALPHREQSQSDFMDLDFYHQLEGQHELEHVETNAEHDTLEHDKASAAVNDAGNQKTEIPSADNSSEPTGAAVPLCAINGDSLMEQPVSYATNACQGALEGGNDTTTSELSSKGTGAQVEVADPDDMQVQTPALESRTAGDESLALTDQSGLNATVIDAGVASTVGPSAVNISSSVKIMKGSPSKEANCPVKVFESAPGDCTGTKSETSPAQQKSAEQPEASEMVNIPPQKTCDRASSSDPVESSGTESSANGEGMNNSSTALTLSLDPSAGEHHATAAKVKQTAEVVRVGC